MRSMTVRSCSGSKTWLVARPEILRITIPGAFLALNCENQPHAFGTGSNKVANRVGHRAENLLFVQRIGRVLRIVTVLFP